MPPAEGPLSELSTAPSIPTVAGLSMSQMSILFIAQEQLQRAIYTVTEQYRVIVDGAEFR